LVKAWTEDDRGIDPRIVAASVAEAVDFCAQYGMQLDGYVPRHHRDGAESMRRRYRRLLTGAGEVACDVCREVVKACRRHGCAWCAVEANDRGACGECDRLAVPDFPIDGCHVGDDEVICETCWNVGHGAWRCACLGFVICQRCNLCSDCWPRPAGVHGWPERYPVDISGGALCDHLVYDGQLWVEVA
jgi:hypothetical protein